MRPSDLHRLQSQIRELVGLHYHPTAGGDRHHFEQLSEARDWLLLLGVG